jgi:hypothetical protein
MSVSPHREELHVKTNPERIGFYKREELNERSSRGALMHSNFAEPQIYRSKIARIYQPQKKHVHNHPNNKTIGKTWVIEFESWGVYKSPLMFWTSATQDTYSKLSMKCGSLSSAVKYCEMMGWGYDVSYPHHLWHTKKSYSDNFLWKGPAKDDESYD